MSLRQIFDAVANTAVSINGTQVPVRNLPALPNGLTSSDLPVRLLLPIGNNPAEGREISTIGLSLTQRAVWQVYDLLLLAPSEAGRGIEDHAATLVDYMDAYTDALRVKKAMTTSALKNAHVREAGMIPAIYNWPTGSANQYYGVLVMLNIEEIR